MHYWFIGFLVTIDLSERIFAKKVWLKGENRPMEDNKTGLLLREEQGKGRNSDL